MTQAKVQVPKNQCRGRLKRWTEMLHTYSRIVSYPSWKRTDDGNKVNNKMKKALKSHDHRCRSTTGTIGYFQDPTNTMSPGRTLKGSARSQTRGDPGSLLLDIMGGGPSIYLPGLLKHRYRKHGGPLHTTKRSREPCRTGNY